MKYVIDQDELRVLSYKMMTPDAQLLYYIIVGTALVKYHIHESPNALSQELVLHIIRKTKAPFVLYIFQHIFRALSAAG